MFPLRCSLSEMAVAATALFGLIAPLRAQAAEEPTSAPLLPAIVTRETAYLSGKPVMIAAARAEKIYLHPEGRYALILRLEEAPPLSEKVPEQWWSGGASLVLWDGLAGRARVIWEQPALQGTQFSFLMDLKWLPHSDTMVAEMMTITRDPTNQKPGPETYSLLTLDPLRDAHARTLYSNSREFGIEVSPTAPRAMITLWEDSKAKINGVKVPSVRVINERGLLGDPLPIPPRSIISRWNVEGTLRYGVWNETIPATSPDEKPIQKRHYFSFDITTGNIISLPEIPKEVIRAAPLTPETKLALRLSTRSVPVPSATGKPSREMVHPLYLQSAAAPDSDEGVYLAPNADQTFLLRDLSAALFVSQQAAYVVPLYPTRRDRYEAARHDIYREQTITQAKEIAFALRRYAQGKEHQFPLAADLATSLQPFLKDSRLFNDPASGKPGFTYLLNGEQTAEIAHPADTPIAYLAGPGGRAVLYADAHVKWEDLTPAP